MTTSTTSTIHHHYRPATAFIAATAALAAIAAGTVAFAVSHDGSKPAPQPPPVSIQPVPHAHHFIPTTSGGHVMLGP